MFSKLFKKIEGLMENLMLIMIFVVFGYFTLQVLRYMLFM